MKQVLCFGEIIWDIIGGQGYLGGAPLNVAVNLAGLDTEASMVSGVGTDENGRRSLEILAQKGVNTDGVTVTEAAPTGRADVVSVDGENRFVLSRPAAYDFTMCPDISFQPEAIVYGTLASWRSAQTDAALSQLFLRFPDALRFYDVNLRRDNYDFETVKRLAGGCTVFKLNGEEAVLCDRALFAGDGTDLPAFGRRVLTEFGCECAVITCGGNGALAVTKNGCMRVPGLRNPVVDTVGAGDAFSAGFLSEYMQSADITRALYAGNLQGAKCVTHAGAF